MLFVCTITDFAVSGMLSTPPTSVWNEGASSMHGDIGSSDTTPLPGPGVSDANIVRQFLFAACPTLLIRSDGAPFVLSTSMLGQNPVIRLLSQRNGREEARLSMPAGSLLGGVYAFLDDQDRLVMVDGNQNLIRVKAEEAIRWFSSNWKLSIDDSVSLQSIVTGHCGSDGCDAVVSISSGADDTIWFATQQSLVGIYDPMNQQGRRISWLKLGEEERIDNSFSTTVDGRAAIVTNKALYLLRQDDDNKPDVVWRHAYDAGTARKPGQLSHGSGATPTFFGPETGTDYVMITDNADDRISLVVIDADEGRLVCQQPIFTGGVNAGTENSAIGISSSVIVASTYGYPYPKLPEGAGPSVPESADFAGGMIRVDINGCSEEAQCEPCHIVWENSVPSAAVPKLSTADGFVYTVERRVSDDYYFTVIDFDTGAVLKQSWLGSGFFADTLQMAGNIGIDNVYWQGTISGVVRIAPQ